MSGRMRFVRAAVLAAALFGVTIPGAGPAAAAAASCMSDKSVQICVVSASLTKGRSSWGERSGRLGVTVSISLRIRNVTDYPLDVALWSTGWGSFAFTPQNAESITNMGTQVSGIAQCQEGNRGCDMTTVSPQTAALVQIQYDAAIGTNGLALVQIASTASFSGSLLVTERGERRRISIALSDIPFGNALASLRE